MVQEGPDEAVVGWERITKAGWSLMRIFMRRTRRRGDEMTRRQYGKRVSVCLGLEEHGQGKVRTAMAPWPTQSGREGIRVVPSNEFAGRVRAVLIRLASVHANNREW